MKRSAITILLMLFMVVFGAAADELVSIDYAHTARLENSRVKVTIESSGRRTLTVSSPGSEVTTSAQISEAEITALKKCLDSIDWVQVSEDRAGGLDGSVVRISHRNKEIKLWSPEHQTRKRGLVETRSLIKRVFAYAGLNEFGLHPSVHR